MFSGHKREREGAQSEHPSKRPRFLYVANPRENVFFGWRAARMSTEVGLGYRYPRYIAPRWSPNPFNCIDPRGPFPAHSPSSMTHKSTKSTSFAPTVINRVSSTAKVTVIHHPLSLDLQKLPKQVPEGPHGSVNDSYVFLKLVFTFIISNTGHEGAAPLFEDARDGSANLLRIERLGYSLPRQPRARRKQRNSAGGDRFRENDERDRQRQLQSESDRRASLTHQSTHTPQKNSPRPPGPGAVLLLEISFILQHFPKLLGDSTMV